MDPSDSLVVCGTAAGAGPTATILAKQASELMGLLLGPIATELGLAGQDAIRMWRLKNQVGMLERARAICHKAGIPFSNGTMALVFPLIDAVGNVDDPTLQELWAQLLARGLHSPNSIHPAFVEVLKQLSAKDAELLRHASRFSGTFPPPINETMQSVEINANSLSRLGIFTFSTTGCSDAEDWDSLHGGPRVMLNGITMELSPFGRALCTALDLTTAR